MSTRPKAEVVRFADSNASLSLDLLRGLAAVLVMLSHWRSLFFVDYPELPVAHRALYVPFYLVTGAGHQSVILFFVLSGYFISGSIFRALWRGRWSWRSYAVHRLARLWTVLVPGLLVCLVCDWIGMRFGPAPGHYFGGVGFVPDVRPSLNVVTFAGNLVFLQTLHVRMFGSDSALWSLAYEFWYYVLFPLGLFAVVPGRWLRRFLFAVAAALCGVFVCRRTLPDLPVWLAGVVLIRLPAPPRFPAAARWLVVATYAVVFFLILKVRMLPEFPGHYVLAMATVALLWMVLSVSGSAKHSMVSRAIRRLSGFSFTLYVIHIPLLMLMSEWMIPRGRWLPTSGSVAVATVPALLTLAFAWGLASMTESHTDRVRRFAERQLGLAAENGATRHERVLRAG